MQGCVTDDDGGSDCDTMIVTVEPVGGELPDAVDDEVTTSEDIDVPIDVLFNDTAPDDGPLEIVAVSIPDHGTATINNNTDPDVDTITYDPPQDFFGTATFTYTIRTGGGGEDTATVTVTVDPVNDEPVVVPGPDRTGNEGSPITISGTATDVDGPLPFSFHWEVIDGPDVSGDTSSTFANQDSATTQFARPGRHVHPATGGRVTLIPMTSGVTSTWSATPSRSPSPTCCRRSPCRRTAP